MQARVACLSTMTVHEPHSAMPQPYFVPVSPTSSRRNHSNGRSGSPSQFCSWPLIVSLIMIGSSLFISCQSLFRREREHISQPLNAARVRFLRGLSRKTDLPVSASSPACFALFVGSRWRSSNKLSEECEQIAIKRRCAFASECLAKAWLCEASRSVSSPYATARIAGGVCTDFFGLIHTLCCSRDNASHK